MFNPLHPDNKTHYQDNDLIDVALNGDCTKIYKGRIRGLASEHIIDMWIVEIENPFLYEDLKWPYSCITVQHTFLRKRGSNEPFLCERR